MLHVACCTKYEMVFLETPGRSPSFKPSIVALALPKPERIIRVVCPLDKQMGSCLTRGNLAQSLN